MKHHVVTLTRVQLAAIADGRLVRLGTDHGLLTISLSGGPGVARLGLDAIAQLESGATVESDEPLLHSRLTFTPATESLMEAMR